MIKYVSCIKKCIIKIVKIYCKKLCIKYYLLPYVLHCVFAGMIRMV